MARTNIPHALDMRRIKYGDATDAERDEVAERLRKLGRRAEALLLYETRPDHPQLETEIAWAVAEGQAFHLLSIRRLGRTVDAGDMRKCATEALERKRYMDARLLYLALEDSEAVHAIAEHLPPSLRPEAPPSAAEGSEDDEA